MDGWWLPCARPTSPATVQRCPGRRARRRPRRAGTCARPGRRRSARARGARRGCRRRRTSRRAGRRSGRADALRVVGAGSGERHQPGLALGDLVVAGAPALRAVVAEAGDREDDQARVAPHQLLDAEAEPLQHAGAEVLHQHVGTVDQPEQDLLVGGVLEVERDRLLVAVGAQEVRRLPRVGLADERRPPAAGVVAAAGRLHLDHAGAESPSICVQCGPARARVRSTTRRSERGPVMVLTIREDEGCPDEQRADKGDDRGVSEDLPVVRGLLDGVRPVGQHEGAVGGEGADVDDRGADRERGDEEAGGDAALGHQRDRDRDDHRQQRGGGGERRHDATDVAEDECADRGGAEARGPLPDELGRARGGEDRGVRADAGDEQDGGPGDLLDGVLVRLRREDREHDRAR